MSDPIIGLMSPGDMGHRIGETLRARGLRVLTALDDRSEVSRRRALRAGLEDAGGVERLVGTVDVMLSIMPPARALDFAQHAAQAIARQSRRPLFVDCNAVAPGTMRQIAAAIAAVGSPCLDASIIGPPPGHPSGLLTRIYASGANVAALRFIEATSIQLFDMGPELGRASAIKMCFAALTKGTMTLRTAVLLAGEMLGVSKELHAVLAEAQGAHWAGMRESVPFLAADAGRWAGEMDEVAATFAAAGMTPRLGEFAAEMFRLLDATPLAAETREDMDHNRTLDQALAVFAETLRSKKAAE